MKILFTGDLFLGGDLFESHEGSLDELDFFHEADLRICNLEQGTGDNSIILNKSTVSAPLKSLNFLVKNKINIVNLANNHIQDKGEEGFLATLNYLNENKIKYLGGGRNLEEARKPVQLNKKLFLFSFCTLNKTFLKKVKSATNNEYGVNVLSYENVLDSLKLISSDSKAILLLHWGRENVWLPHPDEILLAKKLLSLSQVTTIIGMHSHRLQGKLRFNDKTAFFSLGNFLFPNFYISPRTQICYPMSLPAHFHKTSEYHPVFSLTYKYWKVSNRNSLVLTYDSEKKIFEENFVKQLKFQPKVIKSSGNKLFNYSCFYQILSSMIILPPFIYKIIELLWRKVITLNRMINILSFYIFKEKKLFSILKLKNNEK